MSVPDTDTGYHSLQRWWTFTNQEDVEKKAIKGQNAHERDPWDTFEILSELGTVSS